nr:lactonase like protein [uncultured Mediterranean phage uvMED]
MPRRKSISNSKVEDFEPKKKNPLSLLNDSNLDIDSKALFIGGKPSGIELSDSEFRFLKPSTHTRLNADTLFCNEFLLDSSGDSNLTFRHILGDDDQNMKFFISTAGATTWQTNGSSGTFNIDAVGAINFDTDGGELYISDDSAIHFFFDCNNTALTIYDDQDTGDLFKIQIAQHGATTISTVDDDATAGHLTLDADGNTIVSILDGNESGGGFHVALAGAANRAVSFSGEVDNNTTFRMYEMGGTSTSDYLDISTFEEGQTTISTVDGNASAAHLLLDADGRIIIDSVNSAGAVTDGTLFRTSGTTFGSITTHHALSTFTLFEAAGSSTNDYFEIQVDAAGATKLNTVDAAGATAHLTLNPDGDVKFDSDGILIKDNGDVSTPASGYGALYVNSDVLYFKTDGGTATNLLSGGGGTAKETVWFYKNFYSMSSTTWRGGYPDNDTANATVWGLSTTLVGSNYTDTALTAWSAQTYSNWCAPADCTVTSFTANAYQNTADTDVVVGLWKVTPAGSTNHAGNWTCDYVGGITFTANADTSTVHANQTITSFESGADFSTGDLLLICATDGPSNTGTDRSYWRINGSVLFEYD